MILLLHAVALTGYALAATLLAVSFARGGRQSLAGVLTLLGVGVAAHAASLGLYRATWGELPLVGLGPSLSVLAFLIALGSLAVAAFGEMGPLGLVLLPLVVLLGGVSAWTGVQPSGEPLAFRGPWFAMHVVLAFLGYASLALAFAAGLMYLLQFRELKSKRFGAVFRFFPPLDTLDRVGQRALLAGFPALTLGLVLGWAWTVRFQGSFEIRNPHVLSGVLAWVVIAAVLGVHAGRGRQGWRAALASVLGFAVVVVSYVMFRVQSPDAGFL